MESLEHLFVQGKFVDCSRLLSKLLKLEGSGLSDSLDVRYIYYLQHNKIICDALCQDWLNEDISGSELHQSWAVIFTQLITLGDTLRCDLLTSDIAREAFLATTLNLLSWSWENLGNHSDGYADRINKLTLSALQSELSLCGESVLDAENVLELAELFKKCLLRIPPLRSHLLLDIVILSLLHMLHYENCERELKCLKLLEGFFEILPQIHVHLTSGTQTLTPNTPSLFFLGLNIASTTCDPNLTQNFIIIVSILYLLKMKFYDKAWRILQSNNCAKNNQIEIIIEYLKALVCLRRNELDRALYHIAQVSSMPMEVQMVKRKNIFWGWIHILKSNFKSAIECFRDNSGLPEDEDQSPIHVYLMAQAYGALGQYGQQLVLLDCVADVLREDPHYLPGRVTPISSLQDRLLRCVHIQPELTVFQTLLAAGEASIKFEQPAKASEYLLEAIQQAKCNPDYQDKMCEFVKPRSISSVMRDAIVSLLKCKDVSKARILCNGLLDPYFSEIESDLNQAITRLLLVDVETDFTMDKKQAVLLDAVKLLKKEKVKATTNIQTSDVFLIDLLMARTLYRKAKLYANSGFNEDATTYFKRALAAKEGDLVVLRQYQRHLFMIGKTDDAKQLVKNIDTNQTQPRYENLGSEGYITLNYLLHENEGG